jgi:uncharacterized protein (TIGR02118 family)
VPRKQRYDNFQEETMIKVSVMYPNKPGVRFDHAYYRTKHLPLIKSRMGAALKYYTIDKALMDGEGKPLGAYVAMCHLLCDSFDAYQAWRAASKPGRPTLVATHVRSGVSMKTRLSRKLTVAGSPQRFYPKAGANRAKVSAR